MGLRVFDFQCPQGHVTEHFVDSEIEEVQCECECIAHRMISAPQISLDGTSGHFPTASDAWEKRRASHMKKEQKNKDNHGSYE